MRTLALIALLLSLPTFAENSEVLTETVSAKEFFTRITGLYQIDLSGGEKPHEGTDIGSVSIEEGSGLMSFSYCQPGGICDLNDQYFPLDKVTVTKTTLSTAAVSYELSFSENDSTKKFTWDEVDGKVILKNYQYMMGGKLVTLEHDFHKKAEVEVQPTIVDAKEFFSRITGLYQIDLAGGQKPHEGTDVGSVSIEDGSGLMSFSYCQPQGLCDLNDQYFPLDKMIINKTTTSPTSVSYELTYADNNTTKKFTWDEVDSKIILKNYQYMIDDKPTTLEHQFHKKTD